MNTTVNRRIVLKSRPTAGLPAVDNFALDAAPMPVPADGQVLVRTLFASVDPGQKGWISDAANYSEPVAIGDVIRSMAVGEVVESRNPNYAAGDILWGMHGWQEYALGGDGEGLRKVDPEIAPVSTSLGIIGHTGLTAYFGLLDIGAPLAGETVVVSTAAGAVGSAAGQIARIKGCRTVGLTGTDAKVGYCRDEFGYDAAINYRTAADLGAAMGEACPDGIDVYFDNTGGAISDAVLPHINVGARIVICGTAATARWDPPPQGPRIERLLLVKRARMQGFLILDHMAGATAAIAQLSEWYRAGLLKYREHVVDGLEAAPAALVDQYGGRNDGKVVVRL